MPSQAPREDTVSASCDGMSYSPGTEEHKDYLKGFRQVCYWAAAVIAPLVLVLLFVF